MGPSVAWSSCTEGALGTWEDRKHENLRLRREHGNKAHSATMTARREPMSRNAPSASRADLAHSVRSAAVIVKGRRIISTGYVGAPAGLPTCDEVGHLIEVVY